MDTEQMCNPFGESRMSDYTVTINRHEAGSERLRGLISRTGLLLSLGGRPYRVVQHADRTVRRKIHTLGNRVVADFVT